MRPAYDTNHLIKNVPRVAVLRRTKGPLSLNNTKSIGLHCVAAPAFKVHSNSQMCRPFVLRPQWKFRDVKLIPTVYFILMGRAERDAFCSCVVLAA